jgi:hypothetical protein
MDSRGETSREQFVGNAPTGDRVTTQTPLLIFYQEPDGDRWLPFDRYPRRFVRRLVRGPRQPGGMERYYLNLADGLRRVGTPHRANAYGYAQRHPGELVGIIGKGHLLRERRWKNPIVFGPAVFSHPDSDAAAFRLAPVRKILVSCEWFKGLYEQGVDIPVEVWPAGVDTYRWCPAPSEVKDIDILVYDKVRWNREKLYPELIAPILAALTHRGLKHQIMRYGSYREEEYQRALSRSRAMIFLVEHETQGFAYLQALASGVPILAWDRGGDCQDPEFYPQKVKYGPVTSVPYWDRRCGLTFPSIAEFPNCLDRFLSGLERGEFAPREYILENLTLEGCAQAYARICEQTVAGL